jgi:hypothetical protein
MTFKHFLETAASRVPQSTSRVEPILLARAVAKLSGTNATFTAASIAEIQANLANRFTTLGETGLSRRDVTNGCRLFFATPNPPGRNEALSFSLINKALQTPSRAALLGLIDSYLDSFSIADDDVRVLASRLEQACKHWPWKERDRWPVAIEKYSLFEVDVAPVKLAKAAMDRQDVPLEQVLEDAGLDTPSRQIGKLSELAFANAARSISKLKGKQSIGPQNRLIDWAGRDKFVFPGAWAQYASGLLLPWSGERPPIDHGHLITKVVIDYASDPRLKPQRWEEVDQNAVAVVKSWLMRESFEMFFGIVDRVITDRADMWAERKAFWKGYLDRGEISEAWVVLGSKIAMAAELVRRQTRNEAYGQYGALAKYGSKTEQHAALMMKIGQNTVVDWSHNGRYHIWTSNAAIDPPKFYKSKQGRSYGSEYTDTELGRGADVKGVHDQHGSWKRKVAQVLHKRRV